MFSQINQNCKSVNIIVRINPFEPEPVMKWQVEMSELLQSYMEGKNMSDKKLGYVLVVVIGGLVGLFFWRYMDIFPGN